VLLRRGPGGDIVARVTASATGSWELRGIPAGTYLLVETNQRGERLRYQVTVVAGQSRAVGSNAGDLPVTGSNTGALTRFGLGLLGIGAVLTAAAAYLNRRRALPPAPDGSAL
jgi:hypothetical protein